MAALFDATRKAVRPIRSIPQVRAVCVLGSVARGQADLTSDVDLLVVVAHADVFVARTVRRATPAQINGHSVQLRILSAERLREIREARTVYAAHVATEARVLFDRRRDIGRLRRAFPSGSTVAETGTRLRRRLDLYADLTWCNGHFLACFADLYAFGRAGAILALGRRGVFEFGRRTPFEALSILDPRLAGPSNTLLALEPFYLRDRRDAEVELPFPHRDAHETAEAARDACRRILQTVP
jgi:predicted nucleotidyltransferase